MKNNMLMKISQIFYPRKNLNMKDFNINKNQKELSSKNIK